MPNHFHILTVSLLGIILFKSCDKAPKYVKPSVPEPAAYKELTPDTFKETNDWKFARPNDAVIRGQWWEMFVDPQLKQIELVFGVIEFLVLEKLLLAEESREVLMQFMGHVGHAAGGLRHGDRCASE